jgi:dihydroorotate dehydrogenase (fumarate)
MDLATTELATTYLGLSLRSPLVASASPLTLNVANIERLAACGAGAVVLPSIFQEQIESEERAAEERLNAGTESFPEALSYFPSIDVYALGTKPYLDVIRRARAVADIPIIASLNGTTDTGWIEFAKEIEEAGAHALELNIYFIPADASLSGAEVEQRYVDIVRSVKRHVSLPLAVKLSPYFSAPLALAHRLKEAGADGLVIFNRFYQPDIDVSTLSLQKDLQLSRKDEIRLPLLWTGILRGRLDLSLAATTGVETWEETVKYLLAGADVVMTTSALLRHGVDYMAVLLEGLCEWMRQQRFGSVAEFRGALSQQRVTDPESYVRANYIHVLQSYR